jgi:Cu/Ag efflux pump CusA
VIPLVIATGAGAAGRQDLGTAVFGGMLAATAFGVFFIPVLYVLVMKLVERPSRAQRSPASQATPPLGEERAGA